MFRGFVSIDWLRTRHFRRGEHNKPQPRMSTYLNQIRHARKSHPSPDAGRASANAYLKTVIQALFKTTLLATSIWTGCNAALRAKNQDTEPIVYAQLNADTRQVDKLKDSTSDSAKQYSHLPSLENMFPDTLEIDNGSFSLHAWLHLNFHLPSSSLDNFPSRHPRNRQRWLQLARLVASLVSDRGTGQTTTSLNLLSI